MRRSEGVNPANWREKWPVGDLGCKMKKTPLTRKTPLGTSQDRNAGEEPKQLAKAVRATNAPQRKSFSTKYPAHHDGLRYGVLFRAVRKLPCWLCEVGYTGPGHVAGAGTFGAQGGHTAHHVGRLDADGLLPCCGAAHDLYAGLGGAKTIAHFREWLAREEFTLRLVAVQYVERARDVQP